MSVLHKFFKKAQIDHDKLYALNVTKHILSQENSEEVLSEMILKQIRMNKKSRKFFDKVLQSTIPPKIHEWCEFHKMAVEVMESHL